MAGGNVRKGKKTAGAHPAVFLFVLMPPNATRFVPVPSAGGDVDDGSQDGRKYVLRRLSTGRWRIPLQTQKTALRRRISRDENISEGHVLMMVRLPSLMPFSNSLP